jgi:undecaprenyl-diphosphatase
MISLQSQSGLSLVDRILHADDRLLLTVNMEWQHPFLDNLCLFARESIVHVPLYMFLATFMVMNFGRKGLMWIFIALAMASFNDFVSSQVIKEIFDRPRPCRDPVMAHQIRFIARYCGMNGSFISSHASNHFAVATFVFLTLRPSGRAWSLLFIWAAVIAFAQVYVGVHYPSDVICGALFGSMLGWLTAKVFDKRFGLINHPNHT